MKYLLYFISRNSPEPYKVGAIYLQGLRWSIGYNTSRAYGSHAEDSAIQAFKKKYSTDPTGGVMWCTLSACSHCTKTLEKYKIRSRYLYKYTGAL